MRTHGRLHGGGRVRRDGPALLFLAATLAATAVRPALAQEDGAAREAAPVPSAPAESQPPAADEAPNPQTTSDFIVRTYAIKPKKVWKVLLKTLTEAGYPPEEMDEAAQHVKTSYVDWNQKDHAHEVAGAAPLIGPDYHILQMVHVPVGKVSLEAVILPAEGGSQLKIRARLLVRGLDRRRRLQVMADRKSAGTLESEFLGRLDAALGVSPS